MGATRQEKCWSKGKVFLGVARSSGGPGVMGGEGCEVRVWGQKGACLQSGRVGRSPGKAVWKEKVGVERVWETGFQKGILSIRKAEKG